MSLRYLVQLVDLPGCGAILVLQLMTKTVSSATETKYNLCTEGRKHKYKARTGGMRCKAMVRLVHKPMGAINQNFPYPVPEAMTLQS